VALKEFTKLDILERLILLQTAKYNL